MCSESCATAPLAIFDAAGSLYSPEIAYLVNCSRYGSAAAGDGRKSLDQAIFRLRNGKLIRQMLGIPMGDALSPGMTIKHDYRNMRVDGAGVDGKPG